MSGLIELGIRDPRWRKSNEFRLKLIVFCLDYHWLDVVVFDCDDDAGYNDHDGGDYGRVVEDRPRCDHCCWLLSYCLLMKWHYY